VDCERSVILLADTQAPVISGVTATPTALSPPNRQMIPVQVQVEATDDCSRAVSRIVTVTSNETATEPLKAKKRAASGEASADWLITGDLAVNLRAERKGGKKNPRIYTIVVESTDAAGNATTGTVQVTVP
jgi:hypothetical protein